MKRLALTLVICLGCMSILGAQNVWKPISSNSPILGAASNGDLYAMGGYSGLLRSQDEGETWQVVLGYETGFSGYINQHCFAVSNEGRICVFNDNQQTVVYSDDNGDTWQQTPSISSCAMPDKAGLCVPTNDIMVVWAENGEISYTLDGGVTWEGWILDFLENSESVSDLLVNENGDVYVSVAYYIMNIVGIYHSTLSDIQNWELVAFEGVSIKDMAFDREGNVVACGYNADGSSVGFQHIPGFYLFDGTSLAISDEGVVYTPHFMGLQAVLSYSTDHGEHFTEIGEHLPLVDIAPGGENARLSKGADNHLYFDGGGEYWKTVRDADHILENFLVDNTRWAIYYQNLYLDWAPYIQIGIKGDTIVDGTTYHKVIKCTSYGNVIDGDCFGGIRVEADGKWYFRLFSEENVPQYLYLDMEPNTERLLYDFSLSECDRFYFEGDLYENPEYWMSVFDIDEIEINGSMRRRLWFDSNCEEGDHPYDWNWIEGIGCNFGLLYSIQAFPLDGSAYHLGEVYQDGELIYRDPYFINEPSSFAPQGAEWYFHVWSQGPITEPPFYYIRHAVTGEAEVQGHLCSIIDGYRYVYEEDGVVYMYNHSTDAFTVMYDFNAEEGDTWYCDIEEGFTCLVTVESVDSVTWNGHTYCTQYVTGYIPDEGFLIYDGRIIEGIGYEKGLFPHEFVYDGTEYAYMRCYLENGEMLYHEGDYDCDYVPGTGSSGPEWYYKIQNENGSITYQYMYQAGDTIVGDEPSHILVKINTLYDKGLRDEVTHEYVYERDGKLYWWNKTLEEFTVLYDYEAEVGDSWEIKVGTRALDMHVDAVEEIEYEGRTYRVMRVSDPENLFSGNIVCGIGHLTSFFPERLMDNGDGLRVEGLRCYWIEDELVFKPGDEDCDAIYSEVHGVEEDGPSTGSGTFAVYPNPTNGILTVHHSAFHIHHSEFQIANLMGQTVLSGNINAENQQIDVSSLPQGMYFITFAGETRKFVVR